MPGDIKPAIVRGDLVLDGATFLGAADTLIQDQRIAAVGWLGMPAPDGTEISDASRRLVHPGLVNAHTHGHGKRGKSMGDRWPLELLLAVGRWLSEFGTRRRSI